MPRSFKKFQMYKKLYVKRENILSDAKKIGETLGITPSMKGRVGLTGSHSSFPGPISKDVLEDIIKAQDERRALPDLVDDLRDVVKDFYGDDYDAAPIASGEAALWTLIDVTMTPTLLGRGETYRTRYIAPFERHVSHQSGFGRPFPPKYKYVSAERYITAGELGVEGKRLAGLDTVLVPLSGARYDAHGIKYYPAPLLSTTNAKESGKKIAEVAERHASMISGFASLAYDTPGYGYGDKDDQGVPLLQREIADLAKKFDVPYITDDAWGMPFIGTDLRKTGASAIFYSVDKVMRGPLSSLIIGKDEVMVPVRRALAMHSHRHGSPMAYAKAMYSAFDPGREAIVAQIHILRSIRDDPKSWTALADSTYKVAVEEFDNFPGFKDQIIITKSVNNLGVEVNYDRTWLGNERGIPIFTEEDSFSGTALIESALSVMGILPTITYDGNILISPGQGTIDASGRFDEDKMRVAVRALVKAIEIINKYASEE
jgi:hypothetical protein